MKFKATDFRAICYGIAAVTTGFAALYQSGALDKVVNKGKENINKFKKKEKVEVINNPVIQQATSNLYYSECFRNGGYNN